MRISVSFAYQANWLQRSDLNRRSRTYEAREMATSLLRETLYLIGLEFCQQEIYSRFKKISVRVFTLTP